MANPSDDENTVLRDLVNENSRRSPQPDPAPVPPGGPGAHGPQTGADRPHRAAQHRTELGPHGPAGTMGARS